MRKMREAYRMCSVILTAAVSCCLFAGCSNSQSASGGNPVTITYEMWQTNMTDYMKERIASFETENPNIRVELKVPENYQTSSADYWKELNADSAENLPDVFVMNAPNFRSYMNEGKLLAINNLIDSSKIISMKALPVSLTDIYKQNDKQYGIPMDYDTIGLWYNKELFDKAGLDYPNLHWTWDDLMSAAEKIDSLGEDTYGFITGAVGQFGYYNTVSGCGGKIADADGNLCLDDTKTMEGIQAWIDASAYSPTTEEIEDSGGPHMLFMKGKVGMTFGGDWEAADYTSSDSVVADVINVTELPAMTGGSRMSVIHGKANVVSAKTKYPDAAKKFLEYLSSAESFEKLGHTGLCIPAHSDYADLFFKQYSKYDMGIFAREAVECSAPYPTVSISGWEDTLNAEIIKMLNKEVSVSDGCSEFMKEIQGGK